MYYNRDECRFGKWNSQQAFDKFAMEPEKSSHGGSTENPGTYLPKSTTVVTPLVKEKLLALCKASLRSSIECSGINGARSFIAESTNNPVGTA